MTKLVSFDIFDTLITRRVAQPSGIFVLMQHIMNTDSNYSDIPLDVRDNFYFYRVNAEYRQQRIRHLHCDKYESTLDDIYNDIKSTYYLSEEQIERLKRLEIQTEMENIVPIESNISKLKELLAQNKRVVLISDMYLPQEVIVQLLAKCDTVLPQVKLYLSSAVGYTKRTSTLFEYVKEQEKVEWEEWTHIGDNKNSDYKRAKELGINAELYNYSKLKKYEQDLLTSKYNDPAVQLIIGCARNERLISRAAKQKICDIGASLAGTLFCPYILWVLSQAVERGIKKLYFIARDGYILKTIADVLIKEQNLDIETYYLYGSRKAWRLPSITTEEKEHYKEFIDVIFLTSKSLNDVFEMSYDEFIKYIPKEFHKFKKSLSSTEKQALKEYLLNNQELLSLIVDRNREKRQNVISYLNQEIDFTKNDFAFVEIDGSGFTQNCLYELVKDFYNGKIITFFLARNQGIFKEKGNSEYCGFFHFRYPLLWTGVELIARAPHGQTLGYTKEDGLWKPILEDLNVDSLLDWGYNSFIEGLESCTKSFLQYANSNPNVNFKTQLIIDSYSKYLRDYPDEETANLLGSIIYSRYGKESSEYAPKIRTLEAIKYLLTGKIKTSDLVYSNARSSKKVQRIITFKQKNPKIFFNLK